MAKQFLLLVLFLFILGCSKEDDVKDKNGIIVSKKAIWATEITDDNTRAYTFMYRHSMFYKNNILVRARKNNLDILKCINTDDGILKWDWNDFIEKPSDVDVYAHLDNSNLIWQASYNNYCIDLNSGKTVWKNASKEHYEYQSLGTNDFFTVSHLVNRNMPIEKGGNIVVMDSKTGKPIFSFKPKYDTSGTHSFDNCGWGYMGFPLPFTKNGNEYILMKFNDPPSSCNVFGTEWLGLYNYAKKEWVYERQKLRSLDGASGMPTPPIISNDKIYSNPNDIIVCHDLMTGQKLWETKGTGTTHIRVLVENGNVYINNDSGILTCLNANNGSVKWVIRASGSSTELSYLNGIIYFVGGGDGKLHAIDAETGNYIWKIESPDKSKDKGAVFYGMCAVMKSIGSSTGKIVVTTGLNAYCYEAIK